VRTREAVEAQLADAAEERRAARPGGAPSGPSATRCAPSCPTPAPPAQAVRAQLDDAVEGRRALEAQLIETAAARAAMQDQVPARYASATPLQGQLAERDRRAGVPGGAALPGSWSSATTCAASSRR